MVKKDKLKLIAGFHINKSEIKKEYKKYFIFSISWVNIYKIDYDIRLEVEEFRCALSKTFNSIRENAYPSEIIDFKKPIDTSKWNSPNHEDLSNELIKRSILCELLSMDSPLYNKYKYERDLLVSIVYTKSPSKKGSIGLQNIYAGDNFRLIYDCIGNKNKRDYLMKNLIAKKLSIEERRDKYSIWKASRVADWFKSIEENKGSMNKEFSEVKKYGD